MQLATVKSIAEFIRSAKGKKTFVFVTGAGCSKSAGIPLASELVEMAKEKYPFISNQLPKDKQNDYMACMECLSITERREFLRPLVDASKINWAHIALACLMKAGYVQRVLTFNFDNILLRACGLLGLYPAVYDFTSADVNLHSLIADPAIVHLHGQSQGFIQLNEESEVKPQAERLKTFMHNTFLNAHTVFIGYSGESDAFFDVIKEGFNGDNRLFWLNYDKDAKLHIEKLLKKKPQLSFYLGEQDADKCLIQLAQALGCFPPDILLNPYGHALAELQEVIDYPKDVGSTDFLTNIRKQLGEDDKKQRKANQVSLDGLFLQGNYKEVLLKYKRKTNQTVEDTDTAAWACVMQALALLEPVGSAPQSEPQYAKAFDKYQEAVRIKPEFHEAWTNWGNALMQHAAHLNEPARSQRYQEAFDKYQEAVRIKPDDHEAWYNWGTALAQHAAHLNEPARSQRYQEAFDKYQEAVRIKPDKHEAWNNCGTALMQHAAHLNEPARSQHYQEAEEKLLRAESLKPDGTYNLACLYALTGRLEGAREKLFHGKNRGTLPDPEHLKRDQDMNNVRHLPWFKDLLA